jgi:hypothetical protein
MCDNYLNDKLSKIALWRWEDLPDFAQKLEVAYGGITTH